jgi:MOSC domain-containing protein YiiM
MSSSQYISKTELEAGMEHVAQSPQDHGIVEMIVARPDSNERQVLEQGEFTLEEGLVGDSWLARGSRHSEDGSALLGAQVTLMNSRYLDLLAGSRARWPLAGDQLIVDLELSESNLPVSQKLQIGTALFEVTDVPHTGCVKFKERYGLEAMRFTGTDLSQRLRGMYAKVVQPGSVQVGDTIQKV